jgi:hypothetical protein
MKTSKYIISINKDPEAPICPCFGLTPEEVEDEARAGEVTHVRAAIGNAAPARRLSSTPGRNQSPPTSLQGAPARRPPRARIPNT